jgi:hypothetical protein
MSRHMADHALPQAAVRSASTARTTNPPGRESSQEEPGQSPGHGEYADGTRRIRQPRSAQRRTTCRHTVIAAHSALRTSSGQGSITQREARHATPQLAERLRQGSGGYITVARVTGGAPRAPFRRPVIGAAGRIPRRGPSPHRRLWPGAAVERRPRVVLDHQLRRLCRRPVGEKFGEPQRHVDSGGHARCGDDPVVEVLDHPLGCRRGPQTASSG